MQQDTHQRLRLTAKRRRRLRLAVKLGAGWLAEGIDVIFQLFNLNELENAEPNHAKSKRGN